MSTTGPEYLRMGMRDELPPPYRSVGDLHIYPTPLQVVRASTRNTRGYAPIRPVPYTYAGGRIRVSENTNSRISGE